MQNDIEIYHVVQDLRTFLLTGYRRKDRQTNSHSDYSADLKVVQLHVHIMGDIFMM